jgi:hypothetical protein
MSDDRQRVQRWLDGRHGPHQGWNMEMADALASEFAAIRAESIAPLEQRIATLEAALNGCCEFIKRQHGYSSSEAMYRGQAFTPEAEAVLAPSFSALSGAPTSAPSPSMSMVRRMEQQGLLDAHDAAVRDEERAPWLDMLNVAWGIICNAGDGDWSNESSEWKDAAARFRDDYHAAIRALRGQA